MVAIAGGKPRQMGLLAMIQYYVDYQREVIYKRSVFELATAKDRAHIVEGLLVAIKNIDEVIRIIKSSKHTTEARTRLMQTFKLSELQAQAILDLRLARLTSLEVFKLEEELKDLYKRIEELTKIINSKKLQFEVVKKEMSDIKKRFYVDRRTKVVSALEDVIITADDDAKPVEDCVIIITVNGDIKRVSAKHFNMCKTSAWAGMREPDIHFVSVKTQTDKLLHFFTDAGKCYKLYGDDIPECKLKDNGIKFKVLFPQTADNERPVSVYAAVPDQFPELEIVWLSKTGMIKRSKFADACNILKSIFDCYKLREDRLDEIVKVETLKKDRTIVMVTNNGNILNAATGDIPVQGRIATGVKGIQIDENSFCAGICTAKGSGYIIAVTNYGNAKKVDIKNIDKMVRYRKGLQFVNDFAKGEEIIFACWTRGGEDLVAKTEKGEILFKDIDAVKETPRTGKMKNIFGRQKLTFACIHRRATFKSEY
jgi:DNA gyrase subunit A